MSHLNDTKNANCQGMAVCIENLTVKYGETPAIVDVCLNIKIGDYLGIIGPNGGGKTTLLKSILGLVVPVSGKIDIFGRKPGQAGQLLGYVPQITALDKSFPITVHEVVLTGTLNPKFSLFHKYSQKDIKKVDELLDKVGIYKLKGRMVSELSGGEFQKMLIARALAINPNLLLLDEPTASVDVSARDQIFSMLSELKNSMTIILVTHDLLAVSSHVESLACLNGRLVYHGNTELNEEVVNILYGCPIDLIAHGVPHRVLKDHEERV